MTEIHKLVEQQCGKNSPKRVIFSFRTGFPEVCKKTKEKNAANNYKHNTWSKHMSWVSYYSTYTELKVFHKT